MALVSSQLAVAAKASGSRSCTKSYLDAQLTSRIKSSKYSFSSAVRMAFSSSSSSKVVEHVVFFQVKEETVPEKSHAMTSALQGLKSLEGVKQLTTGPATRFTSNNYKFTHALHSRYSDKQALADYSMHPRHVSVVKENVLPIVSDILALDWETELPSGADLSCSYGALRVQILKPVEQFQRSELIQVLDGYKGLFPSAAQMSFGENFSPQRAKGFTWGFLSLFPSEKDLDEFNANKEHVKIQNEKLLPNMESSFVLEYVVNSPNPANL